MDDTGKIRENRLRRMAKRQALILSKSRRRDPCAIDFGGFMLTHIITKEVVIGATRHAYDASIDEIEEYLTTSPSGIAWAQIDRAQGVVSDIKKRLRQRPIPLRLGTK